jgi:N-acetylneuraminic acid mutarotase
MVSQYKKYRFRNLKFIVVASLLAFLLGCNDEEDDDLIGNWVEMSDFEGVPRSDAVSFNIGSKAYVGCGYDGENRLSDFWVYDSEKNSWKDIADFPGTPRNGAIAFSANNKGYVGLGFDGINKLSDFWCYDPTENQWTQIADFGGSARYGAIAFSIQGKGYVGSGYDGNYLKDFWQYDPSANAWTKKTSIGGGKRKDAVAFVIEDKGYIVTGIDNGSYENDFWRYDPSSDTWTELRSISDATEKEYDDEYTSIVGINKVAFTVGSCAYLIGGSGTIAGTAWEYNSVTDLWELKTSFEGTARTDAVAFTVNDIGYVTTGRSSSYYFDDIWLFEPDSEYDEYD